MNPVSLKKVVLSMMKQQGLQTKLLLLCLGMAAMTTICATAAYIVIGKVIQNYGHVAEVNFPSSTNLANMRGQMRNIRLFTTSLGISVQSKEQVEDLINQTTKSWLKFDEAKKAYLALPADKEEAALFQITAEPEEKVRHLVAEAQSLVRNEDAAAFAALSKLLANEFAAVGHKYTAAINPVIDHQEKQGAVWKEQGRSAGEQGIFILSLMSIGAAIIAGLGGFFFARQLSRTLSDLADRLGSGATGVAAASQQISSAGADLSAATSQQAAALQETAAAVNQVSAMVDKTAENARRSLDVGRGANQVAVRGKDAVNQMLVAMDQISRGNDDIKQQTESSNREIADIVKVIGEIASKTKVINDIVFQTRLLSFNASVEAARAGEHGKGFAVVAEEVGNLAQMSGIAAREIGQLLDASTRKVEETVSDNKARLEGIIAGGSKRIATGVITARHCGESLDEIVGRVQELNQMVGDIANASDEQAKGVAEINKAMGQLDQVTQQNATGAEAASQASSELNDETIVLRELVQALIQTIQGSGGSEHPVRAEKDRTPRTEPRGLGSPEDGSAEHWRKSA